MSADPQAVVAAYNALTLARDTANLPAPNRMVLARAIIAALDNQGYDVKRKDD